MGANCSVTNERHLLVSFKNIKSYAIGGVANDGPAIRCTGLGYLPWKADTSEIVYVKCYYSKDAAETIISPTDIVANQITDIHAWGQHCNLDSGQGWLKLYYRASDMFIQFNLTNVNNLWYHDASYKTIDDYKQPLQPLVRRLNQAAQFELFHQRFGHPGERAMTILHKYVDHVPPLKGHAFYKCASCAHAKTTR